MDNVARFFPGLQSWSADGFFKRRKGEKKRRGEKRSRPLWTSFLSSRCGGKRAREKESEWRERMTRAIFIDRRIRKIRASYFREEKLHCSVLDDKLKEKWRWWSSSLLIRFFLLLLIFLRLFLQTSNKRFFWRIHVCLVCVCLCICGCMWYTLRL